MRKSGLVVSVGKLFKAPQFTGGQHIKSSNGLKQWIIMYYRFVFTTGTAVQLTSINDAAI